MERELEQTRVRVRSISADTDFPAKEKKKHNTLENTVEPMESHRDGW